MKMYKITFTNIQSNKTEVYMNNTGFEKTSGENEIKLLEKQQDYYEECNFGRTRKNFKLIPIG